MSLSDQFLNCDSLEAKKKAQSWRDFLQENNFDFNLIKSIDLSNNCPIVTDVQGNKFSIDFENDKLNYAKKKSGMKTELLGKAMGSGRYGLRVLDLSAGLGIDAVFLAQLGFEVTAVERNPLIFLCLKNAAENFNIPHLQFEFAGAIEFIKSAHHRFDVVYFDPMFPEKQKSALPRQEMVFFKRMVGADEDADTVLQAAATIQGIKRLVVKRPLKAPVLFGKPVASIEGKLIRFDLYGVPAK